MELVRSFYGTMLADPVLGPIFTDVAAIDLEDHLPRLVEFWHSLLFHTGAYKTNAMEVHLALHRKHPLTRHHFDLWLHYFESALNNQFEGPRSQEALQRARDIAGIMQWKIKQLNERLGHNPDQAMTI